MWLASRWPCVPQLGAMRPLQGRGTDGAHSGGVAPGYYLVPLQGTKNPTFGPTLRRPFLTSQIGLFGYPCSG
jgi:hypothetical protein